MEPIITDIMKSKGLEAQANQGPDKSKKLKERREDR